MAKREAVDALLQQRALQGRANDLDRLIAAARSQLFTAKRQQEELMLDQLREEWFAERATAQPGVTSDQKLMTSVNLTYTRSGSAYTYLARRKSVILFRLE